MALHGVIDMRPEGSPPTGSVRSLWFNEAYTSIYKFLQSTFAQSIGIERVAYHTGSQTGGGEGYWNEPRTTGNNAWSCWRWLSASVPFYMLMQYSNAGTFGATPGNPALLDNSASQSGLGFAFAMRPDGGNPWNGTTSASGTTGQDLKRTPVWTSGSNALFVWPRCNSFGGTREATRDGMMGCPPPAGGSPPAFGGRVHFLADENNVLVLGDYTGDMGAEGLYFGKYVARSGSNVSCPYVCLRSAGEAQAPFIGLTTYGPVSSSLSVADGGIAHPRHIASGTKAVQVSYYDNFLSVAYQPNQSVGSALEPAYDEWPIHIGPAEAPNAAGYIGHIDFIKLVYGVESLSTNKTGTRLFYGNAAAATKLSIPWVAGQKIGIGSSRSGSMF